jgi:hypothetical protein
MCSVAIEPEADGTTDRVPGANARPILLLTLIDFGGGYAFAPVKPQNPASEVAQRAARVKGNLGEFGSRGRQARPRPSGTRVSSSTFRSFEIRWFAGASKHCPVFPSCSNRVWSRYGKDEVGFEVQQLPR